MRRLLARLLGDRGENAAVRFLRKLGYRILARQFRNQFGEIDIIAQDGNQIVFVEVKTRSSADAGEPFEAVDRRKQQKLTRIAAVWLKKKRKLDSPARFDIVSIVWPQDSKQPEIQHFINAFDASDTGQFFT